MEFCSELSTTCFSRRRRAFAECLNKTHGLLEMHCPRIRHFRMTLSARDRPAAQPSECLDRFLTLPRAHFRLPNTEYSRPTCFCSRKTGRASVTHALFGTQTECAVGALASADAKRLSAGKGPLGKFVQHKFSLRRRAFGECLNQTHGLLEMHCPRIRHFRMVALE